VADVVIVGGGIGGLATALLLGRDGRRVVLCERDGPPVPDLTEEMWSRWGRPGTPQARLGHAFLPGFRRSLEQRLPDVLDRVLAAGAPLLDYTVDMPGDARVPEDRELTGISCRRGVFEGILRQAVHAEPSVEIRLGYGVDGLVGGEVGSGRPPQVVGVTTRTRGTIRAQTVVIAGGRTAPVGRWFAEIGATPPAEESEGCGFLCFTRYFRIRLREGEDERVSTRLRVQRDLGYMKYEVWGADACTFYVELLPPVSDHDLRGLRDEEAWTAAALSLPECPEWLHPDRSTPIGAIAAMGQERNVHRRFVEGGEPLALGVHVIGDARCQTNSAYAWGAGTALAEAVALADILAEHADPRTQALAFEAQLAAEVAGRHEYSRARDRAWQRGHHGAAAWDEADAGAGFIHGVVVPAAQEDADIHRAVMRWELQLDPVGALAGNTAVLERARVLAADRPAVGPGTTAMPTRDELLHIITGGSGRLTARSRR
jgi:2-polyprenyl-6-methoxyphenol hydroxylase-like FAD-dependent oxidoreductase